MCTTTPLILVLRRTRRRRRTITAPGQRRVDTEMCCGREEGWGEVGKKTPFAFFFFACVCG